MVIDWRFLFSDYVDWLAEKEEPKKKNNVTFAPDTKPSSDPEDVGEELQEPPVGLSFLHQNKTYLPNLLPTHLALF